MAVNRRTSHLLVNFCSGYTSIPRFHSLWFYSTSWNYQLLTHPEDFSSFFSMILSASQQATHTSENQKQQYQINPKTNHISIKQQNASCRATRMSITSLISSKFGIDIQLQESLGCIIWCILSSGLFLIMILDYVSKIRIFMITAFRRYRVPQLRSWDLPVDSMISRSNEVEEGSLDSNIAMNFSWKKRIV